MQVQMLKDTLDNSGERITCYRRGEIHNLPPKLATGYVRNNWAEEVKVITEMKEVK